MIEPERVEDEIAKELNDVLKVGGVYKYIGDGEFEIVDVLDMVNKALEKTLHAH